MGHCSFGKPQPNPPKNGKRGVSNEQAHVFHVLQDRFFGAGNVLQLPASPIESWHPPWSWTWRQGYASEFHFISDLEPISPSEASCDLGPQCSEMRDSTTWCNTPYQKPAMASMPLELYIYTACLTPSAAFGTGDHGAGHQVRWRMENRVGAQYRPQREPPCSPSWHVPPPWRFSADCPGCPKWIDPIGYSSRDRSIPDYIQLHI